MKKTKDKNETTQKLPPTTEAEYNKLLEAKTNADKAFFSYRSRYRKEHGIKSRTTIEEIIKLHTEGKSNKEIITLGYNKYTVEGNVYLYKKGKRSEKTVVRKFLPVPDKSKSSK